jgi:hypothetical protein
MEILDRMIGIEATKPATFPINPLNPRIYLRVSVSPW